MTNKELMQMALDAMLAAIKAGDWNVDGACDPDFVLEALRARLAQPEKEWVELTAYEVQELHLANSHWGNFACAIEAKLKEKNT